LVVLMCIISRDGLRYWSVVFNRRRSMYLDRKAQQEC
jgi:hypothetical protein